MIHCDLLLYGRKFSHSVSRLPGDVMGKPQSLDRRQDKRCRTSATSSRDRVRIPSPSESPSSQLKVVGKRSRQRRARSPHLPSTTPRIRHAVAHVQNILFAFCRFARTSDHSSSAISHVYASPLPLLPQSERHSVLQGAVRSDPGRQHEAVHPDRLHLADEQRALAEGDGGPERELPHHGGPGSRPRAAAQSAQRLRHGKHIAELGCRKKLRLLWTISGLSSCGRWGRNSFLISC